MAGRSHMPTGPRARRGRIWRFLRWPLAFGGVLLLLLLAPVGYVEFGCRGNANPEPRDANPEPRPYQPLVTDPTFRRREANTYLTYPEWHIVYAYDGLAEILKRGGDEYAFPYLSSISGFWRSACRLMTVADGHGGADVSTRSMIHTIGVSFTVEMGIKALYEETVGRATAWLRGSGKTPQDQIITDMTVDYSLFLRQTPWYAYPFTREASKLWNAPVGLSPRAWERRLGIGTEFVAKAAYAKVLGAAAAADPAALTIRSVIGGLNRARLSQVREVTIVGDRAGGIEIETPRYDTFTRILVEIARRGGTILEIAGNDDIMVTLTVPTGGKPRLATGEVLARINRSGFASDRLLIGLKIRDLAGFLKANPLGDPGLEHVFDY
jgi:hypothetical protein